MILSQAQSSENTPISVFIIIQSAVHLSVTLKQDIISKDSFLFLSLILKLDYLLQNDLLLMSKNYHVLN